MTDHAYGRRPYDELPVIVAELKRDLENTVKRLEDIATRMLGSVDTLRSDHGGTLRDHEHRIDELEKWRDQKDGASGATKSALAMAFSAGGFTMTAIGLGLRLTGHL